MKTIHILNPAAGQGKALDYRGLENVYITKSERDATEFVKNTILQQDDVHFNVYGGDGTVNEVVNGLVGSENTSFSVVPVGTGNDLLRTFDATGLETVKTDVLKIGNKYAVNAVNTGFDLDVVIKAAEFKKKPFISGSFAYILGVASCFCKKFGSKIDVRYTDERGNTHSFSGECMLAVAANGQYYGGGFHCAPAADISDGLIDLLVIKKVSRLKFLSLILGYKKGKHINIESGYPTDKFKDYILFCKCKSVKFSGISRICADGEIWDTNEIEVSVVPGAVTLKRGEI